MIEAIGAISALVPLEMLQLGPGFPRFGDFRPSSSVFRYLGGIGFGHAFIGAAMSSLLAFWAAAIVLVLLLRRLNRIEW